MANLFNESEFYTLPDGTIGIGYDPPIACLEWCKDQHEVFFNNDEIKGIGWVAGSFVLLAAYSFIIDNSEYIAGKLDMSEKSVLRLSSFVFFMAKWAIVIFFVWYFYIRFTYL